MGGEASKIRLVYSVVIIILALNNLAQLLEGFVNNLMKCNLGLSLKFKCVSVTMLSLVMSSFSCDYLKIQFN